jgi:hypothetical protein
MPELLPQRAKVCSVYRDVRMIGGGRNSMEKRKYVRFIGTAVAPDGRDPLEMTNPFKLAPGPGGRS